MSDSIACPLCTMEDVTRNGDHMECQTCGHEWVMETEVEEEVIEVKDAFGNVLQDGDIVQMIKDKPIKGTSTMLKCGMKSKPIRIAEGDHPISCRMNGLSIGLKPQFVKKVSS